MKHVVSEQIYRDLITGEISQIRQVMSDSSIQWEYDGSVHPASRQTAANMTNRLNGYVFKNEGRGFGGVTMVTAPDGKQYAFCCPLAGQSQSDVHPAIPDPEGVRYSAFDKERALACVSRIESGAAWESPDHDKWGPLNQLD